MMTPTALHPLKILAAVGAAFVLWGLLLAYASSPAWASTITVSTQRDELNTDGDCSLREAVEAANTNAAVDACASGSDTALDTIVFKGQERTFTLDSGQGELLITDDAGLTITAGQKKKITVSGNDATRVFRVEFVGFNLKNLTVADGNSLFGAGLLNNEGVVKVSNSTFTGNNATDDAGAIENDGTMTVSNSTISGNSAANVGGGILYTGPLTVTNSTISDNSAGGAGGGGIWAEAGTAKLKNTIVANSLGGDCTLGFAGTVTDGGYNLIEDGSCITKNSSLSGDPNLGALAENGGPTQTMALQTGSKAIDKGKAIGVSTDQRGLPRPVDFPLITNSADGSDIGAFEVQQ